VKYISEGENHDDVIVNYGTEIPGFGELTVIKPRMLRESIEEKLKKAR
jgi:hypothetical protein